MGRKPDGYVKPNNKKMNDKVKHYSFDITFCGEKCGNIYCYRNSKRIAEHVHESKYPHSFSQFKDTQYCPSYLD